MKFQNLEHTIEYNTYANGGTVIQLYADYGEGYLEPSYTASVWIPGINEGEVAIKDYSENQGILEALVDAGIVEEPHRYEFSGMALIPVCKLISS